MALTIAFAAQLSGASALADEASTDKQTANKTLGFVMTSFSRSIYVGEDECPDGFVQPRFDSLLASLSKPERDRLTHPRNAAERTKLKEVTWRGELCYRPEWLPAPPQRTVQGQLSYGMDLDGGDTSDAPAPNTCAHKNFKAPDGTPGIDNQYYRVVGCMSGRIRKGLMNREFDNYMRGGDSTNLIEITGVDDLRNDDEVMVALYAGADPMEVGIGDGSDVLPHASLEIDTDPRFAADKHVPARGRIKDGVLTAGPIDFIFKVPMPTTAAHHLPNKFRGGRIRLELLPDGSAKGEIAAYNDLESAYQELTPFGDLVTGDHYCPSFYSALKAMADGYPDPKTGECTALSTAFDVIAVPAFVIHPAAEKFAARATEMKSSPSSRWDRVLQQLKESGDNGAAQAALKTYMDAHALLEPIVERERARRDRVKVTDRTE